MRRGHRGGRGNFGRGHQRPWRRFGGITPLKTLAVVAGVVVGGVVAVGLAGLLTLALTVMGIATAGVSWLLTYGWIIAAFLIYRAVRRYQAQSEYAYDYNDDDWDDREEEREREYQRRVEHLRQEQTQSADRTANLRPDTRPREESEAGAGGVILAITAGLALALAASIGLNGLNLSPLAGRILPPLAGAGVGIGVYATLKRWLMPPIDGEKPPAREVRKQVKRIHRKARDLRREANDAGGVFNGLDTKAELLASEASELADRLSELRAVARDVRREFGTAPKSHGVPADTKDPEVRPALNRAQQSQKRLDDLLARNRAAQQRCLAQIERIEDLLDVARLEIACPDESTPADRGREELLHEVETELEASRRALAEVRSRTEIQ